MSRPSIILLLLVIFVLPGARTFSQTTAINQDSAIAILTALRAEHCQTMDDSTTLELEWNDKLYQAALQHAKDMHKRNALKHKFFMQPGLKGKLKREDVSYQLAQETIHHGCSILRCAFQDWMDSPPHRKALLHKRNKEFAVARYGSYWCALFIEP